jgi:hypothetical protein
MFSIAESNWDSWIYQTCYVISVSNNNFTPFFNMKSNRPVCFWIHPFFHLISFVFVKMKSQHPCFEIPLFHSRADFNNVQQFLRLQACNVPQLNDYCLNWQIFALFAEIIRLLIQSFLEMSKFNFDRTVGKCIVKIGYQEAHKWFR